MLYLCNEKIASTYIGNIDTDSLIEYIIRGVSNEETNRTILYDANIVVALKLLKNMTQVENLLHIAQLKTKRSCKRK